MTCKVKDMKTMNEQLLCKISWELIAQPEKLIWRECVEELGELWLNIAAKYVGGVSEDMKEVKVAEFLGMEMFDQSYEIRITTYDSL